jgi:septum formation protein
MKQIIVASKSPRRKEIFEKTGLPFIVEESHYREDMSLSLSPTELAKYLSQEKAKAVAEKNSNAVIIAADTFVVLEDTILGKPHTPEKAKEMLRMLSGKINLVITGVTILDTETKNMESFVDQASVSIKQLTESEIDHYVQSGEPLDKAGAYAIQGLGATFIEKIEGDFYGVMGLPLFQVVERLKKFGIEVL